MTKRTYYVDCPNPNATNDDDSWKPIKHFTSKKNAIAFAKKKWGCDNEGKICLVTGG